jgi:hypothetical protein
MPLRNFTEENDAHLITRFFYPQMKTCGSCNDIIEKGKRNNDYEIEGRDGPDKV